ncbi:hypothetical protein VSR01_09635 [Actinacidiphila sp. DG2A-62]|uniref:WXG100 family type VII secretion target n=1 Tax=Actinacidiphila sp. DG2A-62 TaxID=3108821 RepID=UPI002DB89C5B|nr:hypothetical protein [Actinacidiphila sp. DG2A-62]MEC3993787.1 hypothetical protein [Actinacidiphila sp. DG2A-62]
MSIMMPPELEWVAALAGGTWPKADEDKLWALCQAHKDYAQQLRSISERFGDVLSDVRAGVSGATAEQFESYLRKFQTNLEDVASACEQLADKIDEFAVKIEYAKLMILMTLASLAAEIAFLAWWAPWLIGQWLAAGRSIILGILAEVALAAAIGAGIGGLMSAAAQGIQFAEGHRHQFDWGDLIIAVGSGAISGAITGGLFAGVGALGKPGEAIVSSLLGKMALGGLGGMAGTAASDAAFGLDGSPGLGFVAGLVGGAIGHIPALRGGKGGPEGEGYAKIPEMDETPPDLGGAVPRVSTETPGPQTAPPEGAGGSGPFDPGIGLSVDGPGGGPRAAGEGRGEFDGWESEAGSSSVERYAPYEPYQGSAGGFEGGERDPLLGGFQDEDAETASFSGGGGSRPFGRGVGLSVDGPGGGPRAAGEGRGEFDGWESEADSSSVERYAPYEPYQGSAGGLEGGERDPLLGGFQDDEGTPPPVSEFGDEPRTPSGTPPITSDLSRPAPPPAEGTRLTAEALGQVPGPKDRVADRLDERYPANGDATSVVSSLDDRSVGSNVVVSEIDDGESPSRVSEFGDGPRTPSGTPSTPWTAPDRGLPGLEGPQGPQPDVRVSEPPPSEAPPPAASRAACSTLPSTGRSRHPLMAPSNRPPGSLRRRGARACEAWTARTRRSRSPRRTFRRPAPPRPERTRARPPRRTSPRRRRCHRPPAGRCTNPGRPPCRSRASLGRPPRRSRARSRRPPRPRTGPSPRSRPPASCRSRAAARRTPASDRSRRRGPPRRAVQARPLVRRGRRRTARRRRDRDSPARSSPARRSTVRPSPASRKPTRGGVVRAGLALRRPDPGSPS